MTFKELRQQSGMSLTEFCRVFEIPYKTAQKWEYGDSKCADYLLKLIQFKLEHMQK